MASKKSSAVPNSPIAVALAPSNSRYFGRNLFQSSSPRPTKNTAPEAAVTLRSTPRKFVNRLDALVTVVPEATFKRRVRLTVQESERTERLARVIAAAEYVWENRDEAHQWLNTPHPELDNKSPLRTALTDLGARRVEAVLDRIFYGLPA